jgi:hypothetical protein
MTYRLVGIVACLTLAIGVTRIASAQTGVLSGAIFDNTHHRGIAGVTVAVRGSTLSAVTGKDGRFTIKGVPAGANTLEARQAGYRTFTLSSLPIHANDTAHVYLGLTANPDEDAMASWAAGTITGKIAGVSVRLDGTTEFMLSRPGSGTGPVYVVDGVLLTSGTLPSSLAPEDIMSIEVIKGEAAVKGYGDRGRNGVVVVKTRR